MISMITHLKSQYTPPRVALLRRVRLLPDELPVAQVPAQARRRVALTALAREGLDLGKIRKLL